MMSNFLKINSCFLALAVVFATFGQMQTSCGDLLKSPHSQESKIPAYSGAKSQILWGLFDFESSSSLFNIYSNTSSEEDSKENIYAAKARESSLERTSALYLLIARDIDSNPTIGDLLYPFHFYF